MHIVGDNTIQAEVTGHSNKAKFHYRRHCKQVNTILVDENLQNQPCIFISVSAVCISLLRYLYVALRLLEASKGPKSDTLLNKVRAEMNRNEEAIAILLIKIMQVCFSHDVPSFYRITSCYLLNCEICFFKKHLRVMFRKRFNLVLILGKLHTPKNA